MFQNRLKIYFMAMIFLILVAMSPKGESYKFAENDFWTSYFEVEIGTGIALFPDLPAPTGSYFDGDKFLDQDRSSHVGLPIQGKIKYSFSKGEWESYLYGKGSYITGVEGGRRMPGASFLQLGLGVGVSKSFYLDLIDVKTSVEVGYERTSFLSISRSHYVDALQVRGIVDLNYLDWNLSLYGGIAPWTNFSYYLDSKQNGLVPGSRAVHWQVGTQVGYELYQDTFAFVGANVDFFNIHIEDSYAYEGFGLNVFDFRDETFIEEDLWILSFLIGIQKNI